MDALAPLPAATDRSGSAAGRANLRLARAMMATGAIVSFLLALYILVDVLSRGLGIRGVPGTAELARNLIVIVVFLQLPYCVQARGMLAADFLVAVLPPGLQHACQIAGFALGAVFFAALAIGGVEPTMGAFRSGAFDGDGALRLPIWPVRFAIVAGCALAALSYLILIVETFSGRETRDEAAGVPLI
jgi:TRAP-type C4-dicarboxylate transport system permease small subunit